MNKYIFLATKNHFLIRGLLFFLQLSKGFSTSSVQKEQKVKVNDKLILFYLSQKKWDFNKTLVNTMHDDDYIVVVN